MLSKKSTLLTDKIEKGEKTSFSFYFHDKHIIKLLGAVIYKLFARNNILFLHNVIMTVLREMIINAVKANSKRLYFKTRMLRIDDPYDYQEGMSEFKNYITEEQSNIKEHLQGMGLWVKIVFQKTDNFLDVKVINNCSIQPEEKQRVLERIEKARRFSDFGEVYSSISDDDEGEGLGTLLNILFLRNVGIGEKNYSFAANDTLTQTAIRIPLELRPIEYKNSIQQQIEKEVDALPAFPEHILKLQQMCEDPAVTIGEIVDKLSLDPGLVASVIKLSNSSGFITSKRTANLKEAIMVIGLRNLKSIIIAATARTIMDNKYSEFKQVWSHSNKVAFYARILASQLILEKPVKKKLEESAYMSGLMHDLGKIILLATNTRLIDWIYDLTKNRKVRTSTVMEETAIGVSHSHIGKNISKKWNFPSYLVDSIKYHHTPFQAPIEIKDNVFVTYLADCMCGIEEKKLQYDFIEETVCQRFGISSENDFQQLHETVKLQYEKTNIAS